MSEFDINNERIRTISVAIDRATEIVAGSGHDPLEVFPNPKDAERRADVMWGSDLSEDQQDAFRGVMADLGPGRLYNTSPDDLYLEDGQYVAVFEGGQPHKMIAQLDIVDNATARPSEYIFTASPDRKLGEKERDIGAKLLGIEADNAPKNELEMALAVVQARPGFEYSHELVDSELDGSIIHIGSLGGRSVSILPILREYNEDGSYTQLNNKDKMTLATGRALNAVFVTSSTYQPSCELAAIQATREGATTYVASYGAEELARVKGEALAVPSIAQLGAEAHKTAKELAKLLDT